MLVGDLILSLVLRWRSRIIGEVLGSRRKWYLVATGWQRHTAVRSVIVVALATVALLDEASLAGSVRYHVALIQNHVAIVVTALGSVLFVFALLLVFRAFGRGGESDTLAWRVGRFGRRDVVVRGTVDLGAAVCRNATLLRVAVLTVARTLTA